VAALWPERVRCLVSCTGYNIQNIAASGEPVSAAQEHRFWYQYYFHTERGRVGLARNRRDICGLLWRLWSPEWPFDEATFERTALSFDNPDFVEVVIQSYRHRYSYAPGDPALAGIETELAKQPTISVPTINLHGGHDGVGPAPENDSQVRYFSGSYERRLLPRIGHNVPQEAPADTVAALRALMKGTTP
jgi:pimeloyl-ACP methyl ester carboxylesterase